jgi:hypothetical protein
LNWTAVTVIAVIITVQFAVFFGFLNSEKPMKTQFKPVQTDIWSLAAETSMHLHWGSKTKKKLYSNWL